MQSNHFAKAALLTLLMAIGFFTWWEWYLRSKGVTVDYDDGKELWAHERKQIYRDDATVFIGTSRIKYGLDIETWRKVTGEEAVQLAIEGSSFMPVLNDLAADEDFKGKLVIDVADGFLFTTRYYSFIRPNTYLQHYKNETPSEKAGFWLNKGLESQFVFLDKNYFSLNAFLDRVPMKYRQGTMVLPFFPIGFCRVNADRQSSMTEEFVSDSNQIKWVLANLYLLGGMFKEPPASKQTVDSFLIVVKKDVDKIISRGGQVAFVRMPTSGPFWEAEKKSQPREKYWNRLIDYTGVPGIHFEDYPSLNFKCVDYSHLSPKDAIAYTQNLISILQQKGWKFSRPGAVR